MRGPDDMQRQVSLLWLVAQGAAFALVLGTAIQLFRGGVFSAYVHMQAVFAPSFLTFVDRGAGVFLVLLAVLAFHPRLRLLWLLVTMVLLLYGLSTFNVAGKWHAGWHLVSAASRAVFPAFLFWWDRVGVSTATMRRAFAGLLAVVFFSHGTLAALQTPDFIDYLLGSLYRLSGQYVDEGLARGFLYVVAFLDFITAGLLLFRPKSTVVAWAFLWILLTFSMRLLTGGITNYTEVLVRLPYLYMPWFLLRTSLHVIRR